MVSAIFDPAGPLIRSIRWSIDSPRTDLLSTAVMTSPVRIPALDAGELSMGVTTLNNAVRQCHLNSNAAELTRRLQLHFTELPGVHVARVRIETSEHPINRAFYKHFVWNWIDILAANSLEDVAEQSQQLIGLITLAVLGKSRE